MAGRPGERPGKDGTPGMAVQGCLKPPETAKRKHPPECRRMWFCKSGARMGDGLFFVRSFAGGGRGKEDEITKKPSCARCTALFTTGCRESSEEITQRGLNQSYYTIFDQYMQHFSDIRQPFGRLFLRSAREEPAIFWQFSATESAFRYKRFFEIFPQRQNSGGRPLRIILFCKTETTSCLISASLRTIRQSGSPPV